MINVDKITHTFNNQVTVANVLKCRPASRDFFDPGLDGHCT